MWPGNILLLLFKYFQFSSNTIYNMNSTESKRNKPELYPKQGQELFPVNYQRTTSQADMSNQAIFENEDKTFYVTCRNQ